MMKYRDLMMLISGANFGFAFDYHLAGSSKMLFSLAGGIAALLVALVFETPKSNDKQSEGK